MAANFFNGGGDRGNGRAEDDQRRCRRGRRVIIRRGKDNLGHNRDPDALPDPASLWRHAKTPDFAYPSVSFGDRWLGVQACCE